MDKKEIEKKLHESKKLQSDYFKKKKAERNPSEIEKIRAEMAELKAQVRPLYRKNLSQTKNN